MLTTPGGERCRLFVLRSGHDTSVGDVEIAVVTGLAAQDPSASGYSYAMDDAATKVRGRITG